MILHWKFLGDGNADQAKNPGSIGRNGNARGKIGVSSTPGTGSGLVAPVAKPGTGGESATTATGTGSNPVTQKHRENGSITAATAATAKNSPTEGERTRQALPTPEALAAWGEYLLERASIMEHDGELSRTEADRRAWAELLNKYPAAAAHFAPGGGHA
jgi:hypothetical protein